MNPLSDKHNSFCMNASMYRKWVTYNLVISRIFFFKTCISIYIYELNWVCRVILMYFFNNLGTELCTDEKHELGSPT